MLAYCCVVEDSTTGLEHLLLLLLAGGRGLLFAHSGSPDILRGEEGSFSENSVGWRSKKKERVRQPQRYKPSKGQEATVFSGPSPNLLLH